MAVQNVNAVARKILGLYHYVMYTYMSTVGLEGTKQEWYCNVH
jgi:hypothetical protein